MLSKILALILFFYFLAVTQTSFFVHFPIFGFTPNLIIIAVVFLSFFSNTQNNYGFIGGIAGGFFWDFFSAGPFGFHILILSASALTIEIILNRYVRVPAPARI